MCAVCCVLSAQTGHDVCCVLSAQTGHDVCCVLSAQTGHDVCCVLCAECTDRNQCLGHRKGRAGQGRAATREPVFRSRTEQGRAGLDHGTSV